MPVKVIEKPEFNEDVIVNLPEAAPITHNMLLVKDFALRLKDFYSTIVFTDDEIKNAEKDRAKLNKFKTSIADVRKKKVDEAKLKLGIAEFENACKEAEKMVGEASEMVDSQVKIFQGKEWEEKKSLINIVISEELKDLKLEIIWDDKWKNKGYNLDTIKEDVLSQIDIYNKDQIQMQKEIDVIKRMSTEEKYVERYVHTRDLTSVLNDIEADKKPTVITGEVLGGPKPDYGKRIDLEDTYTFHGTSEQIAALKKYAVEELWMEV